MTLAEAAGGTFERFIAYTANDPKTERVRAGEKMMAQGGANRVGANSENCWTIKFRRKILVCQSKVTKFDIRMEFAHFN
jgi:hypothetical protein